MVTSSEHVLEMTTIQLRAFFQAQHETSLHTDRGMALISSLMASLRSKVVLGFPEYTQIEICTRSVCKDVMGNFVLCLKKCTELNCGHLEHIALENRKAGCSPSCFGITLGI